MTTSVQTDDEVLSRAMDVFNTSGQKGSSNSGAQGQQDSTSVLDNTASGTRQGAGDPSAQGQQDGTSVFDQTGSGTQQSTGTGGIECGNAGSDGSSTGEPGLDLCNDDSAANTTETGASGGTDEGTAGTESGTGQTPAGMDQGADGTGTGQTTAGMEQGTEGTGSGQNTAGTNQGSEGTGTGQNTAGINPGKDGTGSGQDSAGTNQRTDGTGTGQNSTGTNQGTTGYGGQNQAGNLPGSSQDGGTGRRVIVIGTGAPVVTEQERVVILDRELDESMGVFDGVILSRRQEVIARTNETGAGQMEGNGGIGGNGVFDSESDSDTPPLLTSGGSKDPNNMKTAGTLPDAPSDNRKGDYQNGGSRGNIPTDISDGSDDDIVARQLREAAMQEKDPALQEKLWNEYRKYKAGIQAKK